MEIKSKLEFFEATESLLKDIIAFGAFFRRLEQAGGLMSNTQKMFKLFRDLPIKFTELKMELRTSDTFRTDAGQLELNLFWLFYR